MKIVKISDLGEIITGHTPPTKERDYYGDLYPLLKPTDMRLSERYSPPTDESVSEKWVAIKKKTLIPRHATCVVTIGTIGKICIASRPCFTNQAVNSVIPDRTRYDEMYVYYLLKTVVPKVKHLSSGTASGRENVSKSAFSNIEVTVHDLPNQRKIASILSAYDDLIENNSRRIAILEEMAQAIYREWFVNFRFPGHENVKLVESTLGVIPKDWSVRTLSEITSYINRGISPKYDDNSDSFVINQKCIRDNTLDLRKTRKQIKAVPIEKIVRFGDILVNSTGRGTLGRVAQVYSNPANYTVDSHVTIVRPLETESIDYLGFCVMGLQRHFDSQGTGSTGQTELPRSVIGETYVVFPVPVLLRSFTSLIRPIRMQIKALDDKNQNLRTTRDLLLPKLISGQLDVEDIDIETGEPLAEAVK